MTSKAESHYQTMLLESIFELLATQCGISVTGCSKIFKESKEQAAKAAELEENE